MTCAITSSMVVHSRFLTEWLVHSGLVPETGHNTQHPIDFLQSVGHSAWGIAASIGLAIVPSLH